MGQGRRERGEREERRGEERRGEERRESSTCVSFFVCIETHKCNDSECSDMCSCDRPWS